MAHLVPLPKSSYFFIVKKVSKKAGPYSKTRKLRRITRKHSKLVRLKNAGLKQRVLFFASLSFRIPLSGFLQSSQALLVLVYDNFQRNGHFPHRVLEIIPVSIPENNMLCYLLVNCPLEELCPDKNSSGGPRGRIIRNLELIMEF